MATSDQKNGGPVYPVLDGLQECYRNGHPATEAIYQHTGLTKREWFAGQAMKGLLARGATAEESYQDLVQSAWRLADLMLEAGGETP
jgi:hypothetical protein